MEAKVEQVANEMRPLGAGINHLVSVQGPDSLG